MADVQGQTARHARCLKHRQHQRDDLGVSFNAIAAVKLRTELDWRPTAYDRLRRTLQRRARVA